MEYKFELYHWGVKGMKWGVRRYQNKDGSLTPAGKKRYDDNDPDNPKKTVDPERRKVIAKRVAGMLIATAAVSTAAVVYAKNKDKIDTTVKKCWDNRQSTLNNAKTKSVEAGKKYVKGVMRGVKEGVEESVSEAPKKAVKAVITGATLMAVKRTLDRTVGKEEAARMFQANNSKKIGSFWKVAQEDKDDE